MTTAQPFAEMANYSLLPSTNKLLGEGQQTVPPFWTDDRPLIAAAVRGDASATARLWKRYSPLVTTVLRRLFGSSPDVLDLEQEVFLRVFQKLSTLRQAGALRSFILGICFRVGRNHLRHKGVRSIIGLMPDLTWVRAPTDDEDARDIIRRLARLLESVDARDRLLFVSRYVERMELEEIAALYEISLATAKRRIVHVTKLVSARAKSDDLLAPYFEDFSFRLGEHA